MRLWLAVMLTAVGLLGTTVARAADAPDSVLLLGLHVEAIEGYGPMFSKQGRPRTDRAAGYRTLVLHITQGSVRLASELPYLAIPQRNGFLYLGEASARLELEPTADSERDTPSFYDATALWRTTQRGSISTAEQRLLRALERGGAAGAEDTTQVVYATSKVLCVSRTTSSWTGGALAFEAQQVLELSTPAGSPLRWPLSRFADRAQLEQFMRDVLADYRQDDEPLRLDQPYNAFWATIDFRKDPRVCLEHRDGRLWVDGTVLLPGNSARSFTAAAPVRPAPPAFGGMAEPANLDEAKRSVPGALDAVASLTPSIWLVQERAALVAVHTGTRKQLLRLPVNGRIVMAEGARGAAVSRWLKALATP
jgi:hypothetical protein